MEYNPLVFSKETRDSLGLYVRLLKTWQKKFNLIGNSTLDHIWERHIIDSAQLFKLLPKEAKESPVYDIGSGGGLPGVVLSLMGRKDIVLCEANKKKCLFLEEVKEKLGINVIIDNIRAEKLPINSGNAVLARAVAPLRELIQIAFPLLSNKGLAIFPKGKNWKTELNFAQKYFYIEYDLVKSITSNDSYIIIIRKAEKKIEKK